MGTTQHIRAPSSMSEPAAFSTIDGSGTCSRTSERCTASNLFPRAAARPLSKKVFITSRPRDLACAAALEEGSTPKHFQPLSMPALRKYPGPQPMSSTERLLPGSLDSKKSYLSL